LRARVAALALDADLRSLAAANLLGLRPRTVRRWTRAVSPDTPTPAPTPAPTPLRGRPRTPIAPARELEILELLRASEHRLGLPSLAALFPEVARRVLRSLRDRVSDEQRAHGDALIWTTPGTVWSTDFTRPPGLIDAAFTRILLVRDLASHCLLLALPCESESSPAVTAALRGLFAEHAGVPLVIKSDNGSPFICPESTALLARHALAHLRGPPLTPRYNGSIERSAGCLKARIVQIVTRRGGEPGCWSSDDIESARIAANTLCRPWGSAHPTPQERWEARPALTAQLRATFQLQVAGFTHAITQSILQNPTNVLTAVQRATVARAAIRQALVALGLLTFRRPPIMSTQSTSKNGKD